MPLLWVKAAFDMGPGAAARALSAADGETFVFAGNTREWARPLLRRIAGLDDSSLDVAVADQPVSGQPLENRGISYVFPSGALFPHLSVEDNISFGLRAQGAAAFHIQERVAEAVAIAQADGLLTKRPAQLSPVESLRAAVARALVRRPQVLLLDDPLASADPDWRRSLRDELRALRRRWSKAIVLSTGDVADALVLASQLALHVRGRVRQIGRPIDLVESPADRYVAESVGTPPMNTVTLETDHATVLLGGLKLEVPDLPRIVLGIRPEDLSLTHRPHTLPLRGVVDHVEIDGTRARFAVDAKGVRLWACCESRRTPADGAEVTLYVERERLRLFDPGENGPLIPWNFPAARPSARRHKPAAA
jgi:ABC-type sugar transport system ATPase subunit